MERVKQNISNLVPYNDYYSMDDEQHPKGHVTPFKRCLCFSNACTSNLVHTLDMSSTDENNQKLSSLWPPYRIGQAVMFSSCRLLWSPYGIWHTFIFLPCGFFFLLLSFFLPRVLYLFFTIFLSLHYTSYSNYCIGLSMIVYVLYSHSLLY